VVLEHEVEVEESQAGVLAADLLGAGALAGADRVDQDAVLVLGDRQDLP